jgi:hypothetical protein
MSVFDERLVDMIAAIVSLNSQKRELDQLRDRVKRAELLVRKSSPNSVESPNVRSSIWERPSPALPH